MSRVAWAWQDPCSWGRAGVEVICVPFQCVVGMTGKNRWVEEGGGRGTEGKLTADSPGYHGCVQHYNHPECSSLFARARVWVCVRHAHRNMHWSCSPSSIAVAAIASGQICSQLLDPRTQKHCCPLTPSALVMSSVHCVTFLSLSAKLQAAFVIFSENNEKRRISVKSLLCTLCRPWFKKKVQITWNRFLTRLELLVACEANCVCLGHTGSCGWCWHLVAVISRHRRAPRPGSEGCSRRWRRWTWRQTLQGRTNTWVVGNSRCNSETHNNNKTQISFHAFVKSWTS